MTGTARERTANRPGIVEVLVGLAVFYLAGYGVPPLLANTGMESADPVGYGLVLGALSGLAGIAAVVIAMLIRLRRLSPFGVVWPGWRWMFLGLAGGAVVWIVARLLTVGYTLVFGAPENIQGTYNTAAQGGPLALVLSTLFLGVLTPIGEEALFRGVVTRALLRWGWFAGVIGSTVIFSLFHGLTGFNFAMVTAFVEGFVAAEFCRRTGSIWPGVVVHVVNNALANVVAAFVV